MPHRDPWGIYALSLDGNDVSLIYSSSSEIQASALRLNKAGDRLVFSRKVGGVGDDAFELYTVGVDGSTPTRLTDNEFMDVYPAWSEDDARVAFLSRRRSDLDIYVVNADGTGVAPLYDSGDNDGDVDWRQNTIVFTSGFAVWRMNDDGTAAVRITDPPNRGEWGRANLPAGDYDPRLSPDGTRVVFERLEDTTSSHGGYDFFTIAVDGTGETRLTDTGYAQGLASWSQAGDRLVYVVAAVGDQGRYHLYMMNADGTANHDITPGYFPDGFLCHAPVFSLDDRTVYFVGQWWP